MRRSFRTVLATAIVVALAGHPAHASNIDSNLAVSAGTRANGGGCYPVSITPGLLDMLVLINPEWAAVDVGSHLPPLSDPVTVHGTVAFAKINEGGDFPGDHVTDDQNTFVFVDEMGFVSTGNVGPSGVEAGNTEIEWEIGKYPLFAWAGSGDRYTGVGRWIWDCGHPSPNPPGSCSTTMTQSCVIDGDCAAPLCPGCFPGETCQNVTFNYHSELHPPQAVALTRTGGYAFRRLVRPGKLATRTDVWISPDGGGAGDACFLQHLASPLSLLTTDCFPLSQPLANVNTSNFEFDIVLPPKPPNVRRAPRVKVYDQTPAGLPQPAVTTTYVPGLSPAIHVSIDMTTPINGIPPSKAGKTIVAGWPHDPMPITRLKVQVTGIEIVNPLKAVTPAIPLRKRCSVTTSQDCSTSVCPSGQVCLSLGGPTPGWQLFLEANGNWQPVAGLDEVQAPGLVPQDLRYLVGVPAGGTLHLHATGKSFGCLEKQLYGQSLPRDLALYGLTDGATCLVDMSKDIGKFDLSLTGPDYGSGGGSTTYVTPSIGGDGGACSTTTSRLCLVDADCPGGETCVVTGGAFKLHYTITKL